MMREERSLTIGARYCGPPMSGNGGYTAGLLAGELAAPGQPVAVNLRHPPPLDTPLRVDTTATGVELFDGDALVAEAVAGAYTSGLVSATGLAAAQSAQASYPGLEDHPFPTCFVCGMARDVGDGMRLTPGRIGPGRTACVWTPDPSTADETGELAAAEFLWCALDCPGGWASDLEARPLVLGRITASFESRPRIGNPYVVVGALLGTEGRKTATATTMYDGSGELVARAEHLWIAVDPALFNRR